MLKLTETKLRKIIREVLLKESMKNKKLQNWWNAVTHLATAKSDFNKKESLQPVYFNETEETDYNEISFKCSSCGKENEIEIDVSLNKYKTSPGSEEIYYANCDYCGKDNKLDVSEIPHDVLAWANDLGVIGKYANLSKEADEERDIDDPYLNPNRR